MDRAICLYRPHWEEDFHLQDRPTGTVGFGTSEVVLPIFGFVVAPENFLHLLEQSRANQWCVRPAVELVFPNELAFVKRILEQAFEIALCEIHTLLQFESLAQAGK